MKIFVRIMLVLIILAAAFGGLVHWLTSLDFTPRAEIEPGPPAFTFQADDFLVNIPESYYMTRLVGLLEWPDRGRMHFTEELVGSDAQASLQMEQLGAVSPQDAARGAEAQDLTTELGRPAVLVYRPPLEGGPNRPLRLTVKYKGGLVHFTPFPSRRPPSGERPPLEEHRAFMAEQKRLLTARVREFLDAYYWLGENSGLPEPGVFRTHYGLISKRGGESFRYWPIRVSFWSQKLAVGFDLSTRRVAGDAAKICGRGRVERLLGEKVSRFNYDRSNCEKLVVGGREGYELIMLGGYSLEDDSSYQLIWEPVRPELDSRELRLSFKMNSPLHGKKENTRRQSPDEVIGRWRDLLKTVRFFETFSVPAPSDASDDYFVTEDDI